MPGKLETKKCMQQRVLKQTEFGVGVLRISFLRFFALDWLQFLTKNSRRWRGGRVCAGAQFLVMINSNQTQSSFSCHL